MTDEIPWYDRPLEGEEGRIALLRTRVLLARRQAEHERRAAELERAGLSTFTGRVDWIIERWTEEERLAWRLKWLRLGIDPEPLWRPGWTLPEAFAAPAHRPMSAVVPASLARPKRRRRRAPVIPEDRQLEIALGVLERQDAQRKSKRKAVAA